MKIDWTGFYRALNTRSNKVTVVEAVRTGPTSAPKDERPLGLLILGAPGVVEIDDFMITHEVLSRVEGMTAQPSPEATIVLVTSPRTNLDVAYALEPPQLEEARESLDPAGYAARHGHYVASRSSRGSWLGVAGSVILRPLFEALERAGRATDLTPTTPTKAS